MRLSQLQAEGVDILPYTERRYIEDPVRGALHSHAGCMDNVDGYERRTATPDDELCESCWSHGLAPEHLQVLVEAQELEAARATLEWAEELDVLEGGLPHLLRALRMISDIHTLTAGRQKVEEEIIRAHQEALEKLTPEERLEPLQRNPILPGEAEGEVLVWFTDPAHAYYIGRISTTEQEIIGRTWLSGLAHLGIVARMPRRNWQMIEESLEQLARYPDVRTATIEEGDTLETIETALRLQDDTSKHLRSLRSCLAAAGQL